MNEYLVKLRGVSYFTEQIYYDVAYANSAEEVYTQKFVTDDEGVLEIVDVRLVDDELMDGIDERLDEIRREQVSLPPFSEQRDTLEREAFDLRKQREILMESVDWS